MRFVTGISVFLFSLSLIFLFSCCGSAWFGRENQAPVAEAWPDLLVYQGQPFRLDGSRSADPDGAIVSYRWLQTDGKAAGDGDRSGVSPVLVAPFVAPEGEQLRFRLTVTDDGGLSATDSVNINVIKYLFFDDFRSDTTKNYPLTDTRQYGNPGALQYIEVLKKVHAIPADNAGLGFSHDVPACDNGTFSFVFTPSRIEQQGGGMRVFLRQDKESYFEVFNGRKQGTGGLRKVVNGREVDSIRLENAYSPNVPYPVNIIFGPESTIVDAFDELAVMNKDHGHILVKRFEIHSEEQEAYYDNIVLTQDPFVKAVIQNRVGLWDSIVSFKAIPGNLRKGWKIRFILDRDTQNQVVVDDNEEPFHATFSKVPLSSHTLDAYIIDDSGTVALAHDQVIFTARDGYYVAVGDSITDGTGDDSLSGDSTFPGGRKVRSGYQPVLEKLLESAKGYPHTVVNQGSGGDTSANGLELMPTILAIHPEANYFLILYGTNDSSIQVPSGKGRKPGDPGYKASYKDNMQQIISMIIAAGKTPILGKVPIVFDSRDGKRRYRNPDRDPQNILIREYNIAIDELITANSIPVSPPDFYSYFRNHPKELSDGIHPNGRGYRSMAKLWFQVLNRTEKSVPFREAPVKREAAEPILLVKPSPTTKVPEAAPSRPLQVESYMVQVAAFRNPESAETLRKQLLKDGFKAVVQQGGRYKKVLVGPYPDKNAANQAIRKLKAERKLDPFLVQR
jgi:lysophospholipase L1-like esterase